MLLQPCVALQDPLHNLALGHALARHGVLVDLLLQRFLRRYLARNSMSDYDKGFFDYNFECRRGTGLFAHEACPSRSGSSPVLAAQRSIAIST